MPQAWQFLISPLKNRWAALRAASEKAAREGDQIAKWSTVVQLTSRALTDFPTKNKKVANLSRAACPPTGGRAPPAAPFAIF